MTIPDFSPFASEYARSRLRYPESLFAELASLAPGRELAWDCATGSGQAAIDLARHFRRVIATDHSEEQIRHAPEDPRIEYRVRPAEDSGLEDACVDLITVAAAVHWFDLGRFVAEARRVLRPGGLLAVWTYHVGHVEPPFDRVFRRFYFEVLRPYFSPQVGLVDDLYRTLPLPGESVAVGRYSTSAQWTLEQMLAFISSWSGTRRFIEEHRRDPSELIREDLRRLWGPPEQRRTIRWPLFVRACRP